MEHTPAELRDMQAAHRLWRQGAEGGVRADFSGADLTDAPLARFDFRGALFAGADMERADLRRANLAEADFSGAPGPGETRGFDASGPTDGIVALLRWDQSGGFAFLD